MTNKYSFSIDNIEMIEEDPNSNFAVVSLDFFASGDNLNNMYVSEETLLKTANTIKNCPLVWKYDEILDDIYTHDKDEVPCGFVPETAEIETKKMGDGRTMLSVIAYVWKRYTGQLLNIFKRDGGKKPVSVEMIVYEMKRLPSGMKELVDFRYEGITVLGSYVTPAIPSAMAQVLSFSEIEKEYIKDYKKEFTTGGIRIDPSFREKLENKGEYITFPYKSLKDINPALKGISPPISLSQANEIAKQADSIGESEEKSGWAIAISNFKKTHVIKDGKWVKKENKEMTMNKEVLMEEEEKQEIEKPEEQKIEMAEEKSEKEKPEDKEEKPEEKPKEKSEGKSEEKPEEKSEEKPKKEKEEEMAEEEESKEKKENKMSANIIWGNFDFQKASEFFGDNEEFKIIKEEFSKKYDANPAIIIEQLIDKLYQFDKEIKDLNSKIEELVKYKDDIEKSQKAFAIEQTLMELSQKVVIPEDAKEKMIEESEKYSYENLEAWKNYCKALSFEFAIKEKDKEEFVKIGMPFGNTEKKHTNSLWK